MSLENLPVVVIGAGPVGLAAAANLVLRGETPLVLEAGPSVGAGVQSWSHVRTFSPWRYTIDEASRTLLERNGWREPELDGHPTGGDLFEQYLRPLADTPELRSAIRVQTRVLSVTRLGIDKMKSAGRESVPFAVRVASPAGVEQLLARAVIDASGTLSTPNPLGANGTAALALFSQRRVSAFSRSFPDSTSIHTTISSRSQSTPARSACCSTTPPRSWHSCGMPGGRHSVGSRLLPRPRSLPCSR